MAGQAVVITISWVSGTTLVLTVGALGAAAKTLRMWFSNLWSPVLPIESEPEPQLQGLYDSSDSHDGSDGTTLLAKALGIPTADLEAAQERAHEELLSHLVGEGMITRLEARTQRGARAYDLHGPYTMIEGLPTYISDEALYLILLSEELGISTDALQSARVESLEAALTLAVEEGILNETQVADRLLRYRIQSYTDPAALLAEALDISLEELGQRPLAMWMAERRLTWRALNARLAAARRDALDQAARDGIIARDQVDSLVKETPLPAPLRKRVRHGAASPNLWPYGFLYLRDTDNTLN